MNVKNILISQPAPQGVSPLAAMGQKYDVKIDYVPLFLIKPLSSREFRAQRINILDYTAIVFSAKSAIDAFFSLCEELRVKIPETMKYFCTTESVAKYLQKHIVYRKRKIFFGTGPAASVIAEIGTRHAGEKFLITCSGTTESDITRAFSGTTYDWTPAVFVKPVSQDIRSTDLHNYDLAVLYNAADVVSLYENFPDFKQENLRFVSFGRSVVKAMNEAGLQIEIQAPSPEVPSVNRALEIILEK